MKEALGVGAGTAVVATLLFAATPLPTFAADQSAAIKCGERANPTDPEVTEHRYQESGICVTGGDYHTQWWVGNCVPENHQSGPCP